MNTLMSLHRIGETSIPAALDKAKQYRSLLEPQQAESICLDILEISPEHNEARIVLILALTDQFTHSGTHIDQKQVLKLINALPEKYQRLYYRGIVDERRGRALLRESMSRSFAYDYFMQAVDHYDQAHTCHPEHNDDAILRRNACIRTMQREKLQPRRDPDESHLYVES